MRYTVEETVRLLDNADLDSYPNNLGSFRELNYNAKWNIAIAYN